MKKGKDAIRGIMLHNQKQARNANRQRKQINLARRKRLEKAAPELLKVCKSIKRWDELLCVPSLRQEDRVLLNDAIAEAEVKTEKERREGAG